MAGRLGDYQVRENACTHSTQVRIAGQQPDRVAIRRGFG